MLSLITWNVCLAVLAIMMAIAALGLFIFTIARDRLVLQVPHAAALRQDSVWIQPDQAVPEHFLSIDSQPPNNAQIRPVIARSQFIDLETDGMASMMQKRDAADPEKQGDMRSTEPIYSNLTHLHGTQKVNNELTADFVKSLYENEGSDSEKEWGTSSSESSRTVSVAGSRNDSTPLPIKENFENNAVSVDRPCSQSDESHC